MNALQAIEGTSERVALGRIRGFPVRIKGNHALTARMSEKLVKNPKKWRVLNKMTDFFGLLDFFGVVLCGLTRIVIKIGQS